MGQHATAETDFVPHLPDLLVSIGQCRRRLADAQTEVQPFGRSYLALSEATAALDALAHQLTGQFGFLALADAAVPYGCEAYTHDDEPF